MCIRRTIILIAALSLIGCAHVNRYEGADAVSIYRPCEVGLGTTKNGALYTAYIEINQVDDKFTGSGNSCPKVGYTYKIAPGERKLGLISNFVYSNFPKTSLGMLDVVANLEAGKEYGLNTVFDGSVVRTQIIDKQNGKVIASGETEKVKESYHSNGALMAIPFIVK